MRNPIRVVMISHGYYPRVGGAERQLAALTPLLRDQGVDVHVITRRDPGLVAFERVHGIPVYRLPVPGPKVTASLSFTLGALYLLGRLRPDIVHTHGLISPATTALAAKHLFGTPVVAKILGGGGKAGLGDIERLRRGVLGKQRLEKFRRHFDMFLAITREIDTELALSGVPGSRRVLIPNGVDTTRFSPLSAQDREELRRELNLTGTPVVIFTGRLSPEKQIPHLLTLWPGVRQICPNALLLVAGDGPERAGLEQMAGPGVSFLGSVEDVSPYLQAGDIFVLPSAAEGLSNALLEAMAAGLPAIATDVGGASDVITHNENGWLVPPHDISALENAVITLSRDPESRVRLGYHAREHIRRNYALPMIAKRLRKLYEQIFAQA
ncbi:glycosyltransferase family 4 protein [Desulfonema magnum]|uniref:Glycosyl transferase, family I n=1 Tax=Desulfonema magnum TaxID=45655 RepID=A0A975GPX8_9BACT|nr:glycosyltransferase family 4 protein [Desulfonema magnum]QTA88363.1 Glycosyl transferase, family I [Desulfonema magnum]